jgi:hypothetical protein
MLPRRTKALLYDIFQATNLLTRFAAGKTHAE